MKLFENKAAAAMTILSFLIVFSAGMVVKEKNSIMAMINPPKVEPVLELTKEKITLKTGEQFDAESYIKTATDSSGENVKKDVGTATIDTSEEGDYEIVYTLTDGDCKIDKTLEVSVETSE